MNIEKLLEQFKNTEELEIFARSQFNQIVQLTKRNKELEAKNAELIKQSNNSVQEVPQIDLSKSPLEVLDDAKTIAQVQLAKIKKESFERELSLEETKKVEIFNKILNVDLDSKKKNPKEEIEKLDEKELLKLVMVKDGTS